jgi:voltage-gated potassium channel
VVLNVAAVVLETVESLYLVHKDIFYYISSVSLIVFTVEYFLRVWSCDVDPNYRNPVLGRLRYCLTPLAIIDLMVILPILSGPCICSRSQVSTQSSGALDFTVAQAPSVL